MSRYYYNFKKIEDTLLTILALFSILLSVIFALLYGSTQTTIFFILYAIFLYFYITILLLSRSTNKKITKAILFYSVIGFYFALFLIWIFGFSFKGFIVDDNKMLVFVTMLYVFLTYKITKSNLEIFQYQKIPLITIENGGEISGGSYETFTNYTIKNNSEYPAEDMCITIEVLYPIPTKFISALFESLKRSLRIGLFNQYNISKPKYITNWIVESLEPNSQILVRIDEKTIKDSLPVIISKYNSQIYEIKFNHEVEFHVIIQCEYSSQDGITIEKPVRSLFTFTGNKEGIRSAAKGNIPRIIE